MLALHGFARGERKRANGAAVKAAVERDEFVALRVIARELHGGFDGFGAGISEIDALRALARRNGREFFGQFHHALVIEIRAGHVDQLGGLFLDGGDDLRMAMAGGDDGDARGEIEEGVAVHVFDQRAAAGLRDQRIVARVGRRDHGVIALDNFLRFRAGQRGDEVR